ncbi:MAG: radical SAM protein [Deltaproteobacteria bacterium]|nr:radical SAM protein [Deltaproteobacteria bacterium]
MSIVNIETIGKKLGSLPQEILSHPNLQDFVNGVNNLIRDNPVVLEWIKRIIESMNDYTFKRFTETFVKSVIMESMPLRRRFLEENGITAPFTIVINPTMRCNLMCTGCYSFKYSKGDMEYEYIRKLLSEVRAYGVRFITVSGGEPLLYEKIFDIACEYSDMVFLMYTNGLLIDSRVADEIAHCGNIFPAISVEGFRDETDERRGKGVFDIVVEAMKLLKERGVFFGFSVTPTSRNSDVLVTDEFIDFFIDKGVLFGWLFTYIPVGKNPDVSLMASPQQRELLRRKTREWAFSKPIFIGDFFNDGVCTGGCLSASRYCYVTVEGDVQPCTFVQFATHNIKTSSFIEVWRSPLFEKIRNRQPYTKNLLRVCKIIDNPSILPEIVYETQARPTCDGAEEIILNQSIRNFLTDYAQKWGLIADRVWNSDEYKCGSDVYIPFVGRRDVFSWFIHLRGKFKDTENNF